MKSFSGTSCENSPKVTQVIKSTNKTPMGAGDAFEKPNGMQIAIASTAAECNDYLRVLHKQLIKVLKNKPSDIPLDVGKYHANRFQAKFPVGCRRKL